MYNNTYEQNTLYHKGAKGMRWGYTKGKRNGNRTAADYEKEFDPDVHGSSTLKSGKAPADYDAELKWKRVGKEHYWVSSNPHNDHMAYKDKETARQATWKAEQTALERKLYGINRYKEYQSSPQKYVDKMLYALEDNNTYMKKKSKKAAAKAKKWISSFFD